jgi:hypothetical protein
MIRGSTVLKSDNLKHLKAVQPSEEDVAEDTPHRRFPSGWFIAPGIVLAILLWASAIYGAIRFFEA